MAVLVVVRNQTSLDRLLDLLPIFERDSRLEVIFTVDPGSTFGWDIESHLAAMGIHVVPWRVALRQSYALIVAAHANRHVYALHGRKILIPHGLGYNRQVPANTHDTTSAVGTSMRELMRYGRVGPTIIGVSHGNHVEQIRRSCRRAAGRVRLISDPTLDRICASEVRRPEYRRALGVGDRRLVFVTSTWGPRSLLGQHQDFLHALVAQLPVDEFLVAAVLHPNIWLAQDSVRTEIRFRDLLDSGMALVKPQLGWRAALLAADVGIGDFGSVSFYVAAAGRPFGQGANGHGELCPGTPLAMFSDAAMPIDPGGDLRSQLEDLQRLKPSASMERVLDTAVEARGQSLKLLQDLIYEVLSMDQPASGPRMQPIPNPELWPGSAPTTLLVHADVDARRPAITLTRLPGAIREEFLWRGDQTDRFRIVNYREADSAIRANADVLFTEELMSETRALDWVVATAARNLQSTVVVASTGSGCVARLRNGTVVRCTLGGIDAAKGAPSMSSIAGAALYGWRAAGQEIAWQDFALEVFVGGHRGMLYATPVS